MAKQSLLKSLQAMKGALRNTFAADSAFWVIVAMKQWHKHTITKAAAAAEQCPDGLQEMPHGFPLTHLQTALFDSP